MSSLWVQDPYWRRVAAGLAGARAGRLEEPLTYANAEQLAWAEFCSCYGTLPGHIRSPHYLPDPCNATVYPDYVLSWHGVEAVWRLNPASDPAAQLEAEMDADVCAGCGLADLPLGKFRRCRFCAELNTLKNTQPPLPPPPPPPQVCYGAITGLEGSSHGLLDRPSRGPYRVWEWPDYGAMLSVIIGLLIALILILSTA